MVENIIVGIVVLLTAIISVWMIRFVEPDKDIKEILNKKVIAYSVCMFVLCVALAYILRSLYVEQTLTDNLKRICLISILWPIAYIDGKTYKIPNKILIVGLIYRALILIVEIFMDFSGWYRDAGFELLACLGIVGILTIISKLFKGSIGFGDIKLLGVMGLYLSVNGVVSAAFVSFLSSFFVAMYLIITRKKGKKDFIPFGPCIFIGTYLSVFLLGI